MMKRKLKTFIQNLGHDIEDEDVAEQYLDESLPLVGLVVMYFNALEKSLDSFICEIISDRSDEPGLIVLHGSHYSAKVDLFKRFCESFNGAFGTEPRAYNGLIEGLLEAGRLRNLVVHADWQSTDEEGSTYVRIKIQNKVLHQEYAQLSGEALEKVLTRIVEVHHQLSAYSEERGNLLSYGRCHA
jgi:hypothetical protein